MSLRTKRASRYSRYDTELVLSKNGGPPPFSQVKRAVCRRVPWCRLPGSRLGGASAAGAGGAGAPQDPASAGHHPGLFMHANGMLVPYSVRNHSPTPTSLSPGITRSFLGCYSPSSSSLPLSLSPSGTGWRRLPVTRLGCRQRRCDLVLAWALALGSRGLRNRVRDLGGYATANDSNITTE